MKKYYLNDKYHQGEIFETPFISNRFVLAVLLPYTAKTIYEKEKEKV